VYEYFESNRNISKDAENFENRLMSEFLMHASSSTTVMINVISHLKELILKLDKMTLQKVILKDN